MAKAVRDSIGQRELALVWPPKPLASAVRYIESGGQQKKSCDPGSVVQLDKRNTVEHFLDTLLRWVLPSVSFRNLDSDLYRISTMIQDVCNSILNTRRFKFEADSVLVRQFEKEILLICEA